MIYMYYAAVGVPVIVALYALLTCLEKNSNKSVKDADDKESENEDGRPEYVGSGMLKNFDEVTKKIWMPAIIKNMEQAEKQMEVWDRIKATKQFRKQQKDIHENAIKHGWYEEDRSFGDLIALVHSELSEALEEHRNGRGFKEIYYADNGKPYEKPYIKFITHEVGAKEKLLDSMRNDISRKVEGIPTELADVVIRVMDMCEYYGIDLWSAVEIKSAYNKTRPHKHGGKVL